MGNRAEIADSLSDLSSLARRQKDLAAAQALCEECLAIRTEYGDRPGIADGLNRLADVFRDKGDASSARALYEESLAIERELGARPAIVLTLTSLANLARGQGDISLSGALLQEALATARDLTDVGSICEAIEASGMLAGSRGDSVRAASLFGAVTALREQIGLRLSSEQQQSLDRGIAAAREALGEEAFAAGWALGSGMTYEEAIDYALALTVLVESTGES